MFAKSILIRSIGIIGTDGYLSKNDSLIRDVPPTSAKVAASFETFPEASAEEIKLHGDEADAIMTWLTKNQNTSDYMSSCFIALTVADAEPQKTYGYLSSLVPAFRRAMVQEFDTSLITIPNDFAADPGEALDDNCTVLKVLKFDGYNKIMMAGSKGHLITYTTSTGKPKKTDASTALTSRDEGGTVHVKARVAKNKFTTPFETVLTRPEITRI